MQKEIKISKMSGKLEGFKSINTNTLNNDFCIKMHNSKNKNIICTHCYSYYMLKTFRKNCTKNFNHNSKLLSKNIIPINLLPTLNDLYFRFHSHGELINQNHLINFINICNKNPKTTFALYTKRIDLIQSYFKDNNKPNNLIIVYSNPLINKVNKNIPKYFDKVFNVVDKPNKNINCSQKCNNCLNCYNKDKDNIIIELIKPYTK